MGRRGPPPKPTRIRLLQGNPSKRPINKREPKPPDGSPRCPAWLSPEAKRTWAPVCACRRVALSIAVCACFGLSRTTRIDHHVFLSFIGRRSRCSAMFSFNKTLLAASATLYHHIDLKHTETYVPGYCRVFRDVRPGHL